MAAGDRKQPRFDVTIPVRFAGAEDFVVQYTRDISAGGLYVRSVRTPAIGTRLRLLLLLPGSKAEVPVEAEVLYVLQDGSVKDLSRGPGFGVRFAELTPGAKVALESFVENAKQRSRGRALVVDDDEMVREMVASLLRAQNLTVVAVGDGQSALDILTYGGFELIVSDLYMPGVSGFDLRDELATNPLTWETPFVIITANDEPENRVAAAHRGISRFVQKPIDRVQFLAAVQDLLPVESEPAADPVLSSGPPPVRTILRVARDALAAGDVKLAREAFDYAQRLDPGNVEAEAALASFGTPTAPPVESDLPETRELRLAMSVEELARKHPDLPAIEAFVVSRLAGGKLKVAELLELCPQPAEEVLGIIRRYIASGLILAK